MKRDNFIVCRCEDITWQEIEELVKRGFTLEEIKKLTRCGMGYCQGRTCFNILIRLLKISDPKKIPKKRPPLKPISIEKIINYFEK
ncbi:MAG: (2Fe-2S)-binding protein [candidate division WOR-3 bacterium]|uniref:(2Fe-2S)-binding protein n=1 Tax=candidate division WOR-3 bacterium TaxID=2052148 RepID=A0A7V4CI13_UNCW3